MSDIQAPPELFKFNKPTDVNILIGENGSGKSTLLGEIASRFLNDRLQVIAIANSIHDKFENHNRLHLLRGRGGRRQVKDVVKKAFRNMKENDFVRLRNATRAIEYVGYDPLIGFTLVDLDLNTNPFLIHESSDDRLQIEQIGHLLTKVKNEQAREGGIIWLQTDNSSFEESEKASLTQIFKFEKLLRKYGMISSIEVFLSKSEQAIPLLSASSGELSLISSIIYLSTTIEEGAVILIDEPENSLHPSWQRTYVKNMLDIFYYYQPKIIIATHSPLIIISVEGTQVFKSKNFEFALQPPGSINIEEIFYRLFDTVTPQNRFVSKFLIKALNQLANKEISLESIQEITSQIDAAAYDDKQSDLTNGVLEIAQKISSDAGE
jgi:predicted ATP-binding protein involved in virulence